MQARLHGRLPSSSSDLPLVSGLLRAIRGLLPDKSEMLHLGGLLPERCDVLRTWLLCGG
jgi:hypothetical protein